MFWRAIGVYVEVADALELQVGEGGQTYGEGLYEAVGEDVQVVGVHHGAHAVDTLQALFLFKAFQLVAGVLHLPQAVVEAHLSLTGVVAGDPVEGLSLDLTVRAGQSAARLGVVGTVDGGDAALGVLVAGVLLVTFK